MMQMYISVQTIKTFYIKKVIAAPQPNVKKAANVMQEIEHINNK